MTRGAALDGAVATFDSGQFLEQLRRRVAHPTESAVPERAGALRAYLAQEIVPAVEAMGFTATVLENPLSPGHPFLVATRVEDPGLPTVLTYGHGDVQPAHPQQWRAGLDPWQVTVEDGRWYGRGVADNKGQHTVNLLALEQVLAARGGRLGYNVTLLLDMGEESGSPGLAELCAAERELLAADLLIGSDGPRVAADRPTVFLGTRGSVNLTLRVQPRAQAHHSGNWGGVLVNPALRLAHALASLVDARGALRVPALRPPTLPDAVRAALADVPVDQGPDSPALDPDWGEPGLTPSERLFGWNTLEVLAMTAGDPDAPVNAIPPSARAHCQLRCVVGTDVAGVGGAVRAHLDAEGFGDVVVEVEHTMAPTRLDPDDPWVAWTLASLRRSTGTAPALLPNLGGSLPNNPFVEVLGLPTVWVPHSYPGCAQHAPDEHLPAALVRESLLVMAGLWWDLGELPTWPPSPLDDQEDTR
ncbi:M20/M25/M40 family metallo-hydrolase [Modestobacter sp. I12A-02628]|uniref:M20 family metallopeptidase n=1 Tax=Goekera deserti TaxID=2497753 RepID=A0A7K3WG47_9ACTN|nr:M20 family metallopeptidase [Goekera deserti]MPQ96463.1 M20/M25/M40 family metallo-hydrolase [Goekera deserti]NDI47222.1 M20/M25/M40 family metallo-hydrolase [Goekera deserti]NEL55377.1 M20 family metallopeptidase [Goekera deserti]